VDFNKNKAHRSMMFSSHDKTKKDAFVDRSKAARDQRNLGKQQEKAAVKIQVLENSSLFCINFLKYKHLHYVPRVAEIVSCILQSSEIL
jgi:hypothetical protein